MTGMRSTTEATRATHFAFPPIASTKKLLREMESENTALIEKYKSETVKNIETGAEKAFSKGEI